MPKQETSLLEMLAKHPLFGWMRPKPRDDDSDDENGGSSMFCEPRPASTKHSSSSPILLSLNERDSGSLQTAPVSTCASNMSTACWSDQAGASDAVVGSSGSSASAAEEESVPTFQRLGFPEKRRRATDRPNLKIAALDSARPAGSPAPIPGATPSVEIPWRLIDPDLATTPLEKALRHSLGQMEKRMMSANKHTARRPALTTDPSRYKKRSGMDPYDSYSSHHNSYHHRRTRSALPISRADAAARAIAIARGVLPDEDGEDKGRISGDAGIKPPSTFWKPTPTAGGGFGTFNSSPSGGVAEGIAERQEGEVEGVMPDRGLFSEVSTPAQMTSSPPKVAAQGAHDRAVEAPVDEVVDDDDDDGDMMFEFDDLTM
ncbi:unnamed protein product [Scytosiphon promiscuus]